MSECNHVLFPVIHVGTLILVTDNSLGPIMWVLMAITQCAYLKLEEYVNCKTFTWTSLNVHIDKAYHWRLKQKDKAIEQR